MEKSRRQKELKIIIFGSNGQIASNLAEILKEEKSFITNSYSGNEANFTNLEGLKNFLANLSSKPDFIINCSAYTNVDKAEEEKELADLINHQAVSVIANYCKENQIKFIHYSTDYVFDGSGEKPFEANNKKNLIPLNHYGKTKLLGEKAIIKSGCEYLILRVSWVYDQKLTSKNFVNTIKRLATEREILTIIEDQIGSPTSADFVARRTIFIIKDLVRSKKPFISQILHINNGRFISWYQFALEIIEDLRKSGQILKVKEVRPIKTRDYPTKATRPLNSRLEPSNFI